MSRMGQPFRLSCDCWGFRLLSNLFFLVSLIMVRLLTLFGNCVISRNALKRVSPLSCGLDSCMFSSNEIYFFIWSQHQ